MALCEFLIPFQRFPISPLFIFIYLCTRALSRSPLPFSPALTPFNQKEYPPTRTFLFFFFFFYFFSLSLSLSLSSFPSHSNVQRLNDDRLTIADFKLAAVPIGFGYEDFKIKDIEHDADSLSNFVPRQLETVMEEDEPQESEVTESLSEPPQDSEHHGWMQLYVVRSGKTLNKRPKWKEKWCKLQNGKLTFQVSPNPDVSPGDTKVLDILSIQSILGDESGETPDRFIMESARQTYMVLTRSEDATHEWISELLKAKHYAKFTQSKIS